MSADAVAPRALRADARRNRERILDAARSCFAEYGAQAQMDDVARRAGVGVGTVYRHFAGKDALIGELMALKFTDLAERARRHAAADDPWEGFAGLVREGAEEMERDRWQQGLMWLATEDALAHAAASRQRLHDAAGVVIERAKAAGALRADFTVADMPTIMCALGSTMLASPDGSGDWRRLLEILLDGVRAR